MNSLNIELHCKQKFASTTSNGKIRRNQILPYIQTDENNCKNNSSASIAGLHKRTDIRFILV